MRATECRWVVGARLARDPMSNLSRASRAPTGMTGHRGIRSRARRAPTGMAGHRGARSRARRAPTGMAGIVSRRARSYCWWRGYPMPVASFRPATLGDAPSPSTRPCCLAPASTILPGPGLPRHLGNRRAGAGVPRASSLRRGKVLWFASVVGRCESTRLGADAGPRTLVAATGPTR